MITFFRRFFQSKVGVVVTLAFLGLIAVAFASSDVANSGMFGSVTGGDRVAVVGDRRISTAELNTNANNALQQARANNPTLTMAEFIAQGGLDDVLEQMVSRSAVAEYGKELGLRVSDRLVDSEIIAIPAFQGFDGTFDPDTFRAALRRLNLTESTVRDDLAMGLYARQLVLPIGHGSQLPDSFVRRYAQLRNDTRVGSAANIPAAAFAPEGEPSDAVLQEYYDANRSDYVRPERRVIRYATFDIGAVGDLEPVTQEQIARRYQRDAEVYQPTEQRSFTQLVVPTEAAAQAVIDEVAGGVSLEASAQSKGLSTTDLTDVDRGTLQSQSSAQVAAAGFDGSQGALVGPVRGDLGWYVLRVDNVNRISGQSVEQASASIRDQLEEERRRLALNELTARLEDEFRDGRSLSEAAQELGLEIQTTPPLTADGRIYGTQETAPQELARVLSFAFEKPEASDPELTEIVAGEQFLVFDVPEITPSATAPLAEIKPEVTLAWRRAEGMAAANAASARIQKRVAGGASLAEAVAAEDVALPAPQPLRLNRQQVAQQGQVTRASLLFFSMAEGTVKRVRQEETSAWLVIELDEIETPDIAEDGPLFASIQQQLGEAAGSEYLEQFLEAAEASYDVELNDAAIDAVRTQLSGSAN
ncbi:peptidylprolyl isomerase [Aurantiacibacter rhizosphaerae]|uniref:Parvulin-like PPIase n=1 Tax=Aurantiacibacter rhizosphaerae TaxID=2691582 RepID=A0A844XDV9_9SPHN|nr:peptidylprolyl isomerase [Aurantiacibacter rhizosphaerae]MWV27939.1 peptidylprolyl isomerase [Aurantiacibacter rhizosphaerae]